MIGEWCSIYAKRGAEEGIAYVQIFEVSVLVFHFFRCGVTCISCCAYTEIQNYMHCNPVFLARLGVLNVEYRGRVCRDSLFRSVCWSR